jgi:DNA-binding SARP family transcriptional activator
MGELGGRSADARFLRLPLAVRLGLLGPMTVRSADTAVIIGSGRQRALLAVLAASANQTVARERIADLVWDGRPPAREPHTVLRNHVMRLRKLLGGQLGERIVTRPSGYAIELAEHELDLLEFRARYQRAAAAHDGGEGHAVAELSAALALWRGEPFADVSSHSLAEHELPQLEQQHTQLLGWYFEARLDQGRHAEIIGDLRGAVLRYPLQERFRAHLVLALWQAGRRAEALDQYQEARAHLADELGIEPGAELRELQRAILTDGPPAAALPGDRGGTGRVLVPARQLPGAPRGFVGREPEKARLGEVLAWARGRARAAIAVITGMGGIGKSALAAHWAHQVAHEFPDGHLFVNLRGYDPVAAPADPSRALRGFLRALSVSEDDMPADLDDQCALYRSLLSGKKVLIVLDNARSAGQVRPLLPGSPGCMVIVTSRNQLHGLLVTEGATLVPLGLLAPDEAHSLVSQVLGEPGTDAERATVSRLVEFCGRIPLTIRIAATAAAGSGAPLSVVLDQLAKIPAELDRFETGDKATSLRSIMACSYGYLDQPAARLFRHLGAHWGTSITAPAAALLAGIDEATCLRLMTVLVRHSLADADAGGCFTIHRLVRAYAAERLRAEEVTQDRDAVPDRAL